MNRRRFADYFALGCGVVTLLAYYCLRWDALAMVAVVHLRRGPHLVIGLAQVARVVDGSLRLPF